MKLKANLRSEVSFHYTVTPSRHLIVNVYATDEGLEIEVHADGGSHIDMEVGEDENKVFIFPVPEDL